MYFIHRNLTSVMTQMMKMMMMEVTTIQVKKTVMACNCFITFSCTGGFSRIINQLESVLMKPAEKPSDHVPSDSGLGFDTLSKSVITEVSQY